MKLTPEQQATVERLMPRAAARARALRPADEDLVSEAFLRLCEVVAKGATNDTQILRLVKNQLKNSLRDEWRRDRGREKQFDIFEE